MDVSLGRPGPDVCRHGGNHHKLAFLVPEVVDAQTAARVQVRCAT
jgi:hypothetical protein